MAMTSRRRRRLLSLRRAPALPDEKLRFRGHVAIATHLRRELVELLLSAPAQPYALEIVYFVFRQTRLGRDDPAPPHWNDRARIIAVELIETYRESSLRCCGTADHMHLICTQNGISDELLYSMVQHAIDVTENEDA